VSEQRIGRAGEVGAGEVPALAAMHHQLVPGDAAFPRLVRVDHQPRRPVGGPRRRDRKGVRAALADVGGIAIGQPPLGQRADDVVEPEEERRAQREAGDDVLRGHRKQPAERHLVRMAVGVAVDPGGIAGDQRAGVGRQPRQRRLRHRAGVQQMPGEVDPGAVRPEHRPRPAAHAGEHLLQGREIILRMRVADAVTDIGIGLAEDMRHAPAVADDTDIVAAHRLGGRRIGGRTLPGRQADERHDEQPRRRQPKLPRQLHAPFLS